MRIMRTVSSRKKAGGRRQTADGRKQRAAKQKDRSAASRLLPPASCLFYVANRAHHADIGGATPGSMGLATDVYGEGLRIPPIRIVCNGAQDEGVMRLILANVRGQTERRGDFQAQIGSLKTERKQSSRRSF